MNSRRFERFEHIDVRAAERYRLVAYVFFFLTLAVLLMGLVPAMYYGSGRFVLVSLLVAGAFFMVAFFAGGIGWSRFNTAETGGDRIATSRPEIEEGYFGLTAPKAPAEPEEPTVRPFPEPHPSDESRPPR